MGGTPTGSGAGPSALLTVAPMWLAALYVLSQPPFPLALLPAAASATVQRCRTRALPETASVCAARSSVLAASVAHEQLRGAPAESLECSEGETSQRGGCTTAQAGLEHGGRDAGGRH